MDKDIEIVKQEKRINAVFPDDIEDISRRRKTITIYKQFLENNLQLPVKVTGRIDFSWEGIYIWGSGYLEEYEELKKEKPSYTDLYNLTGFFNHYSVLKGLYAKVVRITDKKHFKLELIDLKAVDEESKNYQLIDDYIYWHVNYY